MSGKNREIGNFVIGQGIFIVFIENAILKNMPSYFMFTKET
jgi:hypothetical protein